MRFEHVPDRAVGTFIADSEAIDFAVLIRVLVLALFSSLLTVRAHVRVLPFSLARALSRFLSLFPPSVSLSSSSSSSSLNSFGASPRSYNHMSVSTSNTFSYFTAAFFNCHMLGRTEGAGSCDSIYDASRKAWCPLCGNQHGCPHVWPMQVCETSYSVQLYKN